MNNFTNWIPPIGSICLGIVVGWLARYFLFRFQTFTPQIFGTTLSIVLGGIVIRFLTDLPDKVVVWCYPIGLLLGFVIYSLVAYFTPNDIAPGKTYRTRILDDENEEE
jgi:uncharacterized membrane-anchored protein YhcB (DUF1043 family)